MKEEWLRYSCQMKLPGFDSDAQEKLSQSSVLIVGVGGLGCPAAQYLVASGIGLIGIADYDKVAVTNLHRQILYNISDVGKSKARVACDKLRLMNEQVELAEFNKKITSRNVKELVNDFDVILDCTDNIETKYLLNDACVIAGKPLIYGSIFQNEGQLAVWNVKLKDGDFSPNYRDVFPDINANALPTCAEGGVLPTIAGIIGSMQAAETIKLLTGCGEVMAGKIFLIDGNSLQSRIFNLGKKSKIVIKEIQESTFVETITAKKLNNIIEKGTVQLIDVREDYERDDFHIGGMHVPLTNLNDIILQSDITTVIYCESGRRSEQAAVFLKNKFPDAEIKSLEGGIQEWMRFSKKPIL
jgi:molybdopterin/thiamine biosynthesis adenylyltransferase/rhodanese-related sulfurtransferase